MSFQARSHIQTLAAGALFGALSATLVFSFVSAATVVVGSSGAPDAPTISAGVSMASDGDTILVQTGTYLEIVQTSKSLAIIAGDGAGTVSINALNFGPALSFSNVTGPVTIEGLVMENGGGTRGGGIRIENVSDAVTIRDCEFYANLTTLTGGAIDAYDAVVTIENCVFEDNATTGSTEQRGGAIHLRGFNDGSSIEDCTFHLNSADQGGAVYWKGTCDIQGCTFTDNSAERGGALYASSLTASQIHTSIFEGCSASDNGGAIYAAGAGLDLRYCSFEDCTSGANGGGVYLGGGSATEIRYNTFDSCSANKGGGIGVAGMLTDLYRNTFYACSATTSGAALYFQQTNTQVVQNIFASSTGVDAVFSEFTATPDFICNLVHGNAAGDYDGIDPSGTNGNFDADPEFCDEGDDDFRIASTSPAAPGNEPSESDGFGVGSGGVGCGVTALVETSWGALKSRFHD